MVVHIAYDVAFMSLIGSTVMSYQIKPVMDIETRDIESVVHPKYLKVYFRQLNIKPSFELMSHMHVLLVRGLPYEHRVTDRLRQIKYCVPMPNSTKGL